MARSWVLLAGAWIAGCAASGARDAGPDALGGGADAESDAVVIADSAREDGPTDAPSEAAVDAEPPALPPTAPRAVSCGTTHTCAVTWAGDVRCWGRASHGALGDGTLEGPVLVPSAPVLSGVDQVETGNAQTCALADGKVYCWGHGRFGLLGDGVIPGPDAVMKPTQVPGLDGVRQIGALGAAVCALMGDRTVRCWGWNLRHELGYETGDCPLGDGTTYPCSAVATTVPGITNVAEVSFGDEHACVRIRTSGDVWCWGENNYGQLGDGTTIGRWQARKVEGLPPAVKLSAGVNKTCALTASGQVYCWGIACWETTPGWPSCVAQPSPTLVSGFDGPVVEIGAGGAGGCALLADGRLQCWGLPHTLPFDTKTPLTMPGLGEVTSFCKPFGNTCAINKSGEMFCWGLGPLGDGTADYTKGIPRKVLW